MVWVFKRTAEAQRTEEERREPVVEFKRLLLAVSLGLDRGRKGFF